ncbi:putative pre-mRNA splicing factor [Mytilinidion resinicola]|uniref:Pre-mRNA splicing factor n=1 Tax=Mytilinidion resinicola TaxID=574789 RepID=A0A6A6Y9U6_9PEZI|nr:putative pre-mRNA splicing factor [Mytilinidion resinicola]KAF2805338.1 putative pre-mRNA splicing factor [Mytilinidion resinicola]
MPSDIILPPAGIREVIETTAGYIDRNGVVFESRLRDKEHKSPKFSFLFQGDAYFPYYQWRLREIGNGRGTDVSAGRVGEASKEAEKSKGPVQPPDFEFSARMPNMNAKDLDIVKLTARHAAGRGRAWVTALSQRENGNPQFDFLRPQHSLHQFFTRLTAQYADLMNAGSQDDGRIEKARDARLEHNVRDPYQILEQAKQRAEYVRYQALQKQQEEEQAEKDKMEFAQIDWHDFVVVETVEFTEADEQADLPPPTSKSDLQSASLEQKAMMSLNQSNMRIEEAMPGEETYYVPHAPHAPAAQMPPPQPNWQSQRSEPEPMEYKSQAQQAQEDEDERRIRERQEEREKAAQAQAAAKGVGGPMRIRNDYTPRAQIRKQNVGLALCPNCKQQVPFTELEEHMRIELLDPRWKEQKARADARYSTTNLSTADVANNLKRLASQRSDVFDGVTGLPISEEEAARRKKAATSYDGQPESKDAARIAQMHSLNIEEQLKQIKQKFTS